MASDPACGTGPLFSLAGQVALVLGSSRGIGRACAFALGRQGARVLVNGRDAGRVARTVRELGEAGIRAEAVVFDVDDLAGATAAIDAAEARVGPVDILFANAGVQHRAPLLEFDLADFQRVLFTNLTAQWALARHTARGMAARGHGRIVFTGSITAILGRENVTAYTAAKGALHALVRQWSTELAARGVTVNALAPGYIRTDLTQALHGDGDFDAWLRRRTPAGRWGTPEDLASAMVFLAARESGFVTGQILAVDGGLSATM